MSISRGPGAATWNDLRSHVPEQKDFWIFEARCLGGSAGWQSEGNAGRNLEAVGQKPQGGLGDIDGC